MLGVNAALFVHVYIKVAKKTDADIKGCADRCFMFTLAMLNAVCGITVITTVSKYFRDITFTRIFRHVNVTNKP